MSDSNLVSVAIAAESTFGTAPTSGYKFLRYTGESLQYNINNTQSAEIRNDRNVSDMVRTDASASGDLNFELTYGTFDDLLEGVMCGTFSSDTLKNGTTTKTFTIEKHFGAGVTNPFHVYKGMQTSSMNLSLSAGDMVTGSFSFLGKEATTGTSKQASGAIAAANANPVMNAVNNVASISEGGSAYGDKVMSLDLTVENNLRVRNAIGTLGASSIGLGQFVVTGSMSVYFQSSAVYNKFLAGTDSSLAFQLNDGSNSYTITLPSVEYTAGNVTAGSTNADVMAEMEFQAKYNASEACTMKIVRAS